MTQNIIRSDEACMEVCKALGIDPGRVQRLVLDFQAGMPIVVYVQMIGDGRFLDIQWTLNGAEVEFAEPTMDDMTRAIGRLK